MAHPLLYLPGIGGSFMKLWKLVLLCTLLSGGLASAETLSDAAPLSEMQQKAAAFLLQKTQKSAIRESHPGCYEPPASNAQCMQYVAGSYPTSDQRLEAARACAGVSNLGCVQYVAGSYPTFDGRVSAARSCVGVSDLSCAQYVAGSYPTSDQRETAAQACRYASVDCVRQVAGSYPTFDQRVAAAQACGGN